MLFRAKISWNTEIRLREKELLMPTGGIPDLICFRRDTFSLFGAVY